MSREGSPEGSNAAEAPAEPHSLRRCVSQMFAVAATLVSIAGLAGLFDAGRPVLATWLAGSLVITLFLRGAARNVPQEPLGGNL